MLDRSSSSCLSRLLRYFFLGSLSLVVLDIVDAQETTVPLATPQQQEEVLSPSASPHAQEPLDPSKKPDQADEGSSAKDHLVSEAASQSPSEGSSNTSSSLIPTDPSMIPPPASEVNDGVSNVSVSTSSELEPLTNSPSAMPSTQSIEKKKHEIKIRYYAVRTGMEKEADVSALKEKADHATTDEEKRQALRAYYKLLFAKMKKMDPSIADRCDLMEKAYLRHLEQITLQPTIPLLPETRSKPNISH